MAEPPMSFGRMVMSHRRKWNGHAGARLTEGLAGLGFFGPDDNSLYDPWDDNIPLE